MKGKMLIFLLILFVIGFFAGIEIFHYTSEPEFCEYCHHKHSAGPNGEVFTWRLSSHSKSNVSCLDCHAKPGILNYFKKKIFAIKDPIYQFTHSEKEIEFKLMHPSEEAAPVESCLFCHSDDFNRTYRAKNFMSLPTEFLKFRNLDYVMNPSYRVENGLSDIMKSDRVKGLNFSHSLHFEDYKDLKCTSCHFTQFAHPDPKVNYSYKMKMVCFSCHEKEDGPDNEECEVCHVVQSDIRKGKVFSFSGDEDVMIDVSCKECHKDFSKPPTEATCIDCHDGDEEYGKTLKEWETVIKLKIMKVDLLYRKARAKAKHSEKFKKAEQLFKAVINDKSYGVHNFEYVNSILDEVEKMFKELL